MKRLFLTLLLAAALLTGCGSQEDSHPAQPEEPPQQEESQQPEESPADREPSQPEEPPQQEEPQLPEEVPADREPSLPEQPPQQDEPQPPEEIALPEMELLLSSGAGGWATELALSSDGSFTGSYHDSEMGLMGEDFPNGTCYVSTFSGQFGQLQPAADGSFVLPLEALATEQTPGESWIEEGICYISAEPFGLEHTQEFRLLAPETAVEGLPEDLLLWWPGRWEATPPQTLNRWCLWNEAEQLAFFSDPAL